MADVRCPMCGKPNPAELDVCQFCQARLRPVWETGGLNSAGDQNPAGAGQSEGAADPADWLRALGGSDDLPAESQEPAPDWLSGREDAANADRASAVGGQDDAVRPLDDLPGELPDWLSRLGLQDEDAAPPVADRAADLTGSGAPESGGRSAGSAGETSAWSEFAGDAGLPEPDWFKETPAESQAPDEWGASAADEFPDWLKSPANALDRSGETRAPRAEGALPDWLHDAAEEPGAAGPEAASFSTDPFARTDADLPYTEQPDTSAGFGDWAEPIEEQPDQVVPQASDEDADDLAYPEWFAQSAGEDAPDWLRTAMQDETGGEAPAEPPPVSEPSKITSPPWLMELGNETGLEQTGAGEAASEEDEDFAAWITSVGATSTEPEVGAHPDETRDVDWLSGAGDVPGWLSEYAGEPAAESEPQPAERPEWLPSGDEVGAEVFSPAPDNAEWIASIGAEADRLQAAEEALPPEEGDYDLSWLETLEAAHPGMTLETDEETGGFGAPVDAYSAEDTGIAPGDLPAWLSGGDDESELSPAVEPAAGDALNPGELPSWLMGMRPESIPGEKELAAPTTGFEQVEGAGPLAGLRGVLPAEPDIAQAEKPPTYSVLLQVSEAQNAQTKLLAELVAAETEAPAQAAAAAVGSSAVLRRVTAVLLILTLLLTMLTGSPAMYRPMPPAELDAVRETIEGLESGAPVLVAVEYEPGYSGEMDTAARAVLVHLLRQAAAPTLISTLPTGPMQIERLMAQVGAAENRTLAAGEQYNNLGFISGETLALASLNAVPSAPGAVGAQGVGNLASYRLVIVATADPDRARAWIEQSARTLGNTPLVMILSAQAEPMVRPYFNATAGPVRGILTGLTGALIYETNTAQPDGAVRDWAPFNIGLAIAVTLMLLGAVFNILSGRLARRKPSVEVKDS